MNNGTPVNETFTGNLAAGATATYTFVAKANLVTAGTYNIVAQTMLTNDGVSGNNDTTLVVVNPLVTSLPVTFDFETAATGINKFRKVINSKSYIVEGAAASFGGNSTKGIIMDGVDSPNWTVPSGVTSPWTTNPDNFAALYTCISTSGIGAKDSLHMSFDLKQLYKTSHTSTNFRVTVNGTQVGLTYNPPFGGGTAVWQKVKVDLTPYLNQSTIQIGLESSVKEAYDNGNGTANLLDNIEFVRVAGPNTGVKDDMLASKVFVYPNPSTGLFHIELPNAKACKLTVSDLSGKLIKVQTASAEQNMLDMTGAAKGVYLLKVVSEEGSAIKKLIID